MFLLRLAILFLLRTCFSAELTLLNELNNKVDPNDPVFNLNVLEYGKYVLRHDRPYHVMLLVIGPPSVCKNCKAMSESFHSVAKHLYERGSMDPSNPDGNSLAIFVEIDGTKSEIVLQHGIEFAPYLASINFQKLIVTKVDTPSGAAKIYKIPNEDKYRGYLSGRNKKLDIMEFVMRSTNMKQEEHISLNEKFKNTFFLFSVLSTVVIGVYGTFKFMKYFPTLLIISALLLCWLSTSGLIWSIQHGFQLFDVKGDNIIWIHPDRRGQYLIEGLMMGGCGLLLSLCALLPTYITHSNFVKKMKLGNLIFVICMSLSAIIYLKCVAIFEQKFRIGHVPFSFTPQGRAPMGPLRIDRGNSY